MMHLQAAVSTKLNSEFKKIVNENTFQALLNILHHLVRVKLPEDLLTDVDDPRICDNPRERLKELDPFLPQLIAFYTAEAIARDCLKILRLLQINPEEYLYKKVSSLIVKLYSDTTLADKDKLIKDFKILILQQKIKIRYLQNLSPERINYYDSLIASLIQNNKQNEDLAAPLMVALAQDNIDVSQDKKFHHSCHGFPIIHSIDTSDKIDKRMIGNVIDLINQDVSLEIFVLDNIPKVFLPSNVRLFRGIGLGQRRADKEYSKETLQSFTFETHRTTDPDEKRHPELFNYILRTAWMKPEQKDIVGMHSEGRGVFTTPNIEYAFRYGLHYTMEIVPKAGKIAAMGLRQSMEVIIDQVEPDEIVAIYTSDYKYSSEHKEQNIIINSVYENPNFYGLDFGYKGATLAPGKYTIQMDQNLFNGTENYKILKKQEGSMSTQYPNHQDFISRYQAHDVRQHREKLFQQRGYKTYQDKLKHSLENHTESIQEIFDRLKKSPITTDLSLYKNVVDEMGNDLVAYAVMDNNESIYRHLITNGFSNNNINFNQQNLLHLAAKHNANSLLNLLIENKVDMVARDIEGFTPLYECLNVGNLPGIDIFAAKGHVVSLTAKAKGMEEYLVFERLTKFSKQHALAICYPNRDLSSIHDNERIDLLLEQKTVRAFHSNFVSIQELIKEDLNDLRNLIKELPWRIINEKDTTYPLGIECYEVDQKKYVASDGLLDFPIAHRAIIVSKQANEIYKQTGENATIFKDCPLDKIQALLSINAAATYMLGFKIADLIHFNTVDILTLTSKSAQFAYMHGFKPSDFRNIESNNIMSLLSKDLINMLANKENKAEILQKLCQGYDLEKNILQFMVMEHYPNRSVDIEEIPLKKLRVLARFNPINLGNNEIADKLIDFPYEKIEFITLSNQFMSFVSRNNLRLESFEHFPLSILQKLFSHNRWEDIDSNKITLLMINKDIAGLKTNLDNFSFTPTEQKIIAEWAVLTNEIDLSLFIETHKKSPSNNTEVNDERKTILNKIMNTTKVEEIKEIFNRANYSHINGFYDNNHGFLAAAIISNANNLVIQNLILAGANPFYQRNGRDLEAELPNKIRSNKALMSEIYRWGKNTAFEAKSEKYLTTTSSAFFVAKAVMDLNNKTTGLNVDEKARIDVKKSGKK